MFTPTDLKVIGYDRESRDFMASYDGNVIGFFASYSQAEDALNDYVLGLCQQGLIDQPLTALAQAAALDAFQARMIADLSADPIICDPGPAGPIENDDESEPIDEDREFGRCAVSWGDNPNPSSDDGCGFFITRLAVAATLVLLTLQMAVLRRKPLRRPDPTRPAAILDRRVTHYVADVPQYEAQARCDDGKTRTFVSGPDGRWIVRR